MKPYEREFFIARIYAGYLVYKSNAGYDLHIHSPTVTEKYKSHMAYQEAYNLAITNNVFTEEDIFKILYENNLWNNKHEKILKTIQEDIEKLKVGIFQAGFKKELQSNIRKNLRRAEEKLSEFFKRKHSYSFVTCEGYASAEKAKWLVKNTTRYIDGSPYDWVDEDVSNLTHFYQQEQISDKNLREIAKSPEYRHIWSSSKTEGKIFDKNGFELSEEQKTLMTYSSMYDNVYESMDCPSDSVIDDDDALDGWFIVQRRKREQQVKEAGMDDITGANMGNANEIFVMTDDAKSVYELNDPISKGIVKSRSKQVEEEGEVKYQDFGDVKREIQMQAARQQSTTLKGNK